MGKKLQYLFFFLQTFLSRHKGVLFLSFFLGFLITAIARLLFPYLTSAVATKTITIGLVGQYSEDTLPNSVQNKISMGLTRLDTSGEASPAAALSWKINEKGTVYTINLNTALKWHDGKSFTASDVTYQLKGAQFKVVKKDTIEISLTDPYSPLPVLLSRPLIRDNLVGLGPYVVTREDFKGDILTEITLTPQKEGSLPILRYRFYNNSQDAILAFKMGEIDTLENISNPEQLSSWKNATVVENNEYDRYVGVFFNIRNSSFKEKEIRQALAYATAPIEPYEKTQTPISPLSWAYSKRIRLYEYDPGSALKILNNSPIASESSQITISTFPSLLTTAQKVKDSWEKVGVRSKIKVETEIPDNFEVMILSQRIPSDPDQYQYWESNQDQTNITGYSNPKIDKLLEDGRRELDEEKRKKIYADFQRYLVDDAPVIFLYYPKSYTISRK